MEEIRLSDKINICWDEAKELAGLKKNEVGTGQVEASPLQLDLLLLLLLLLLLWN